MIDEEMLLSALENELPESLKSTGFTTSFCDLSRYSFSSPRLLRDYMIAEFKIESEIVPFLNTELGLDPNTPITLYTENIKDTLKSVNSCPICYKIFKCRKGLNQHMGKKHSNSIKNSMCDVCGKLFSHKYALKFHYQQVHETLKRVNCEECSYVAYNKYKLKKHMKNHIAKKPSNM
ncbi:unnamed protein product [Blepharisma stoltei]|uniref:C2H2-type domain-containing protein n=1 Tax=Blepharisma stoltei TaxID=1481888 RepID=A0AAU9IN51_9CILI|nr:unnamed protein product [Blepharisma stoltei]